MEKLINFLLESSVVLIILYLPYALWGRKSAFHKGNRAILIISMVLSLIIPLIKIHLPGTTAGIGAITLNKVVILPGSAEAAGATFSVTKLLFFSYLAVCSLLFINMLWKFVLISSEIKKSKLEKKQGYYLILTNQRTSPYSFFNYILFNPKNHSDADIEIILRHEREHIFHHHYIDNLFTEMMRIIFWFHPVIYLYKYSIKNIHEYQADHETMQHTDRSQYLNLLYSETLRPQQVGLTTNFSYSPLKRRLKMMLQKPKKQYAGIYYFTWIPVAALLVFFLGTTQVNAQTTKTGEKEVKTSSQDVPPPPASYTVKSGEVIKSDTRVKPTESKKEPGVWLVVEEQPYFPGGESQRVKFLIDNLKYPEEARKDSISGTVYVTFIVEKSGEISNIEMLKGVHPSIDQEAIRVIELMPPWTPGKTNGEAVRVRFNMPIQFKLS